MAVFPQPKTVSNWVMGELLRLLRDAGREARDCPVPPAELAALLAAVEAGTVTRALAKGALETMFREGKSAAAVIAAQGPARPGGGDELAALADRVVAENPDKVAGYRGGKVKLFEFFVGPGHARQRAAARTRTRSAACSRNDWIHDLPTLRRPPRRHGFRMPGMRHADRLHGAR